jgi:D-alanyl-D-alanine carboxypeptidase (penicillin-binding protein 5/6)
VIQSGDLDRELVVPAVVTQIEPTKIGVAPGQKYTRRELLRALLIRSGNDVAACLAIDNAGSIEAFAKKMNAYAVTIGAADSNFFNPHGLPNDQQVSSAHDMALIAFEAYQDPFIRECVKTITEKFTFETGTVRTLYNTNRLLKSYTLCNGMKTGYTSASGHCLVSSGKNPDNNNAERIVVIIGSNRTNVSKDSRALLEWSLNLKMKDS